MFKHYVKVAIQADKEGVSVFIYQYAGICVGDDSRFPDLSLDSG